MFWGTKNRRICLLQPNTIELKWLFLFFFKGSFSGTQRFHCEIKQAGIPTPCLGPVQSEFQQLKDELKKQHTLSGPYISFPSSALAFRSGAECRRYCVIWTPSSPGIEAAMWRGVNPPN